MPLKYEDEQTQASKRTGKINVM